MYCERRMPELLHAAKAALVVTRGRGMHRETLPTLVLDLELNDGWVIVKEVAGWGDR